MKDETRRIVSDARERARGYRAQARNAQRQLERLRATGEIDTEYRECAAVLLERVQHAEHLAVAADCYADHMAD